MLGCPWQTVPCTQRRDAVGQPFPLPSFRDAPGPTPYLCFDAPFHPFPLPSALTPSSLLATSEMPLATPSLLLSAERPFPLPNAEVPLANLPYFLVQKCQNSTFPLT